MWEREVRRHVGALGSGRETEHQSERAGIFHLGCSGVAETKLEKNSYDKLCSLLQPTPSSGVQYPN